MFSGSGYKTRILNPHDEFWDRRLGVHTFGYRPATGSQDAPDWRLHYTPAPYSSIFHSLRQAKLGAADVFTDLGSGMGRVTFSASWLGAKRSNGVEILPDLVETAIDNLQKSRISNRDISFVCANAKEVDLGETTVLFIFHSFGVDTLEAILQKLELHHARNLRIIYVNPVFRDFMDKQPWLRRQGISRPPKQPISTTNNYEVGVWKAR